MIIVKAKDFIEVDYVGRVKESNKIFDLTNKDLAKNEGIFNEKADYSPRVICLGESQILKALDDNLIGKDVGTLYNFELPPEKAFGKKDSSLVKIIPTDVLKKQNINPFPGLQINASGILGIIRSVSGGRTTVDFNHPLAGRTLVYEIKIIRVITDVKEKVSSLVKNLFTLSDNDFELKVENNKAEIKLKPNVSSDFKDEFVKKAKVLIPNTEVIFA